jgi:hypothetical protein
MVRKKIDNRIRLMIENGVTLGHRTMFFIVGDKAKDQVRLQSSTDHAVRRTAVYELLIKPSLASRMV